MSEGKRYLLDANVFIEAHQKYYGLAFCPGFWVAQVRQHERNRVFSIDKVKAELVVGHDWLSRWVAKDVPNTFFKGTADKKVIDAFQTMVNWVQQEQQYNPQAKRQFASVADGWLVAYAKANGLVVVTLEEYAPDAKRRVPIPNVCVEFSVDYCNTFEMLRDLKVQFVLRERHKARQS
jgi:hypothetical protein